MQATYQTKKQHVWTQLENEAVVLQVDSGNYFSLSPVAGRVWELLQEPQSLATLTTSICAEFAVTAEQATADLNMLINQLLAEELIVKCER